MGSGRCAEAPYSDFADLCDARPPQTEAV
ncbi:jg4123, partial [Pararge aegeria aegeria]